MVRNQNNVSLLLRITHYALRIIICLPIFPIVHDESQADATRTPRDERDVWAPDKGSADAGLHATLPPPTFLAMPATVYRGRHFFLSIACQRQNANAKTRRQTRC